MPTPLHVDLTLSVFVALAAASDLAWRKIPNLLVLAGLALALALHLLAGAGPWPWLGGALTGFGLLLPLYLLRGMAAGDVKLMAMVGAFGGPLAALQIALLTTLIGGLMALLIVLVRGRLRDTVANLRLLLLLPLLLRAAGLPWMAQPLAPGASVGGMPYGLAIALGTLLLLGWRDL